MVKINDKQKFYMIKTAFYCILLIIGICVYFVTDHDSEALIRVREEFNKIQPIPSAVLRNASQIDKRLTAYVDAGYVLSWSPEQVLDYYEKALGEQGWKFVHKENTKNLYGIYEGWTYYYKRDSEYDYYAILYFPSREFLHDGEMNDEMKCNFNFAVRKDFGLRSKKF